MAFPLVPVSHVLYLEGVLFGEVMGPLGGQPGRRRWVARLWGYIKPMATSSHFLIPGPLRCGQTHSKLRLPRTGHHSHQASFSQSYPGPSHTVSSPLSSLCQVLCQNDRNETNTVGTKSQIKAIIERLFSLMDTLNDWNINHKLLIFQLKVVAVVLNS